jgi:thiamine pyrophosphokinase
VTAAGQTGVVFGAAPFEVGPRLRARLASLDDALVVAADGGAAAALELGLRPNLVLGDFDSIEPDRLDALRARGIPVQPYPRDKDVTDGELAVQHVLGMLAPGAEVLLIGFLGGPRLDHELANVLLLVRLPSGCALVDERTEVRLLRHGQRYEWVPEAGELVTLLALDSVADGVSTRGLKWQLDAATLEVGSTRGVSNEALGDPAAVEVGRGLLLVVRHFGAR